MLRARLLQTIGGAMKEQVDDDNGDMMNGDNFRFWAETLVETLAAEKTIK
jgi:hypothetical protein